MLIKFRIKTVLLFLTLFAFPYALLAQTIDQAVEQAVSTLTNPIYSQQEGERFLIQIVNLHTQQPDTISDNIETALFFSLERNFPDKKRISITDSTAGVSSRGTLFINGTYEKIGNQIQVYFKVLRGLASGELIAQAQVSYISGRQKESNLVAVLDIESENLNQQHIKIYSEIFRSALSNTGVFELASSADVDKMDPASIQQASGCTRDECATIIGQQLGVDRVISTTLIQRTTNKVFLVGKLIDIKDGSIVRSETVNHQGNKNDLDGAFIELAEKLTQEDGKSSPAPVQQYTPPTPYQAPTERSSHSYSQPQSYGGKSAIGFGVGVPTSLTVSSFTKKTICTTCSESEEDVEFESVGDPEGGVIRWTIGASQGFNFGLSLAQYHQKMRSTDLTEDEVELYHTGLGIDLLYSGRRTLTFGGGFGLYQTNIICDECFYEAGYGFGFSPLKIGYNWRSIGFRFDSHIITSNATRNYTQSNVEYEEEYSWSASIVTFSLLYVFN